MESRKQLGMIIGLLRGIKTLLEEQKPEPCQHEYIVLYPRCQKCREKPMIWPERSEHDQDQ